MNDKAPKSAYELALEKLKQRDRERGETAPEPLSDAQKKAIAEVRQIFDARLVEREILYRSERAKLLGDPEGADKVQKLEEEYIKERRRIEDQRDKAVEGVRSGGPKTRTSQPPKTRKSTGRQAR